MNWSDFNDNADYKEDFLSYKQKIKEIYFERRKLTNLYESEYNNFISEIFSDFKELLKENKLEVYDREEHSISGQVNGNTVLQLFMELGYIGEPLVLVRYKNGNAECVDLFITQDKKFDVITEYIGPAHFDSDGNILINKDITESEEFYENYIKKYKANYEKIKKLFEFNGKEYKLLDLNLRIQLRYKDNNKGEYTNGRDAINKAVECFE